MYVNIGHSEDVIAAWQDDARPEDLSLIHI